MALAWITQVKDDSDVALTLLQNDLSKHPVCNGHQFRPDEPIRVPPGGSTVVQNIDLGGRGGPLTGDQHEFRLHATKTGIAFEPTGAGVSNVFGWAVKLVATVYRAFA
jgi:hypothetical protein